MKVILGSKDVWNIVDKGYTKFINEKTVLKWKEGLIKDKKERSTSSYFHLSVLG